jgi:hypothetical protein
LIAALHVRPMVATVTPAPAVHLIAIAALIVVAAVRPIVLRRLPTAGDERRQALAVTAVCYSGGLNGRLVVLLRLMLWLLMLRLLLVGLMLRPVLLVRLLIAPAVRLRIARRVGRLGVARRVWRQIAEVRLALHWLTLHRLIRAVVAVIEIIVAVVGLRLAALRAIIRVLLAELFLRRGDQAQIMLGVLVIILGGYRVARGRRIARQLNVFLGDMGRRSPNLHVWAVRFINPCERILIFAVMLVVVVTTPHALVVVLTVSHGFPVHQLPI